MCNLGEYVEEKRVEKDKGLVGFRWFTWSGAVNSKWSWFGWAPSKIVLFPLFYPWSNPWTKKIAAADQFPTRHNNNGLYLYSSRERVDGGLGSQDCLFPSDYFILGKIKYWGWVVQHKLGARAQFAQIIMLEPNSFRVLNLLQSDKFYSHINIRPMIRV